MKKLLQSASVSAKVSIATLLTALLTTLILGGSYLSFRLWDEFAKQARNAQSISKVVANSLTAAVAFEDVREVSRILESLGQAEDFKGAAVVDAAGHLISQIGPVDLPESLHESQTETQTTIRREGFGLLIRHEIEQRGHLLGTLYVQWGADHIKEGLVFQLITTIFSFILVGIVALFASEVWKKMLTRPLLALAAAAEHVEKTKDYTTHLTPETEDEIGYLTNSFNRMLVQIKSRDDRLEQHRDSLENQVEQRTREIVEKNKALETLIIESQAANLAKSYFLANMSHEIRTPLNGLLGMLELLHDSPLREEQKEFVSLARFSGKSLLQVVNDVLDFSKIEANKVEISHTRLNIHELVGSVVKSFVENAAHKGIELVCAISPNVPMNVVMDGDRLRQVLANLVGNAIKFTEVGAVVVTVDYHPLQSAEGTLEFKVVDTGIGIPLQKQAFIFEAFNQGDDTTSRKFGGTGLGLAISNRLINLMGGALQVTSEPGRGSTFFFNLQIKECRDTLAVVGESYSTSLLEGFEFAIICNSIPLLGVYQQHLEVRGAEVQTYAMLRDVYDRGQCRLEQNSWVLVDDSSTKGLTDQEIIQFLDDTHALNLNIIFAASVINLSHISQLAKPYNVVVGVKPLIGTDLISIVTERFKFVAARTEIVSTVVEQKATPKTATRVLVAEDNSVNQRLISLLLTKAGFEVTLAETGLEVMSLLRQEKYWEGKKSFDIILMDIQMPELGGVLTTELVRCAERTLGLETHIPIIALTAHAMDLHRKEYLDAGMDEHLTKPIDRTRLIETIRRFTS